MGLYEIMMIIRPDLEADEQEEAVSGLTAVIAKHGGTVSTVLDWRKRKLTYEINKLREGHYYLVYFSGEGAIIPELEHYFRVTDAVIRYMVVSVDEKDYEAAAEKAAVEAAASDTLQGDEAVTADTGMPDADAGDVEAGEEAAVEDEEEPEDVSAGAVTLETETEPEEEKPE